MDEMVSPKVYKCICGTELASPSAKGAHCLQCSQWKEYLDEVAREYVPGVSVKDLAQKYDISERTLCTVLDRTGVRHRTWSRAPKTDLAYKCFCGRVFRQLTAKTVHAGYCQVWRDKMQEIATTPGIYDRLQKEGFRVAAEYGISYHALKNALKRYSPKPPPPESEASSGEPLCQDLQHLPSIGTLAPVTPGPDRLTVQKLRAFNESAGLLAHFDPSAGRMLGGLRSMLNEVDNLVAENTRLTADNTGLTDKLQRTEEENKSLRLTVEKLRAIKARMQGILLESEQPKRD